MGGIIWGRLIGSLCILLLVLVVSILGLRGNGFLFDHYWISETEHLVSGFALAMFYSSFRISFKWIFIWVGIWGLLWEWFEYSIATSPILLTVIGGILQMNNLQSTWPDTVLDTILNFAGAILFILVTKKRG